MLETESEAFEYLFVLAEFLKDSFGVDLSAADHLKLSVRDAAGSRVDVDLERRDPKARYRVFLIFHRPAVMRGDVRRQEVARADAPDVEALIREHLKAARR